MSAGNQQGRLDERLCHYISGFVDGEGSFHIAIQRTQNVALGWQVIPEFHVSQHQDSKSVLELIQQVLRCGYIKPNHRNNPNDVTYVFVVRSRKDLLEQTIPFFEFYPLRTAKRIDFEKFAKIVRRMEQGLHLTKDGLTEILHLSFSMNANGTHRKTRLDQILAHLEPSETVRQTP